MIHKRNINEVKIMTVPDDDDDDDYELNDGKNGS